jgi:hypothetical protein
LSIDRPNPIANRRLRPFEIIWPRRDPIDPRSSSRPTIPSKSTSCAKRIKRGAKAGAERTQLKESWNRATKVQFFCNWRDLQVIEINGAGEVL